MLKRVVYLMAVLWIMAVGTVFAEESKEESQAGWQLIDIGPAEDIEYSFNTNTIKYDRNKDGTVNKNIIIYEEKKTNMVTLSSEYKFYTITECKINVDLQSTAGRISRRIWHGLPSNRKQSAATALLPL